MSIQRAGAVIIAVSALGLAHVAAADKHSDCTTYIRMAANQAVMAKHLKCGYSGLRWETENKNHFSWCMGLSDPYPARIAKERAEQMKELSACATPCWRRDRCSCRVASVAGPTTAGAP
jgi:hypothetical protein